MYFLLLVLEDPTVNTSARAIIARGFLWVIVLLAAVIGAVLATVIDNVAKGTDKTRPHNTFFLIHECMAEHQGAYLVFFAGLAAGTRFLFDWEKPLMVVVGGLALIFYFMGVSATAWHEEYVKDEHICSGARCNTAITKQTRRRILRRNFWFSVILFIIALIYSFTTTQKPTG